MYWLVKEHTLPSMKMLINDVMMHSSLVWHYYWHCDPDGCHDDVNEYNIMALMTAKWCDMELSDQFLFPE